jgi:RNA polymerase sigma factor (sigma-70 family)
MHELLINRGGCGVPGGGRTGEWLLQNEIFESQGDATISSGDPGAGAWLEHRLPDWPRIWGACRRRIRSWPSPPRWTASDWREEIDAEGIAAACKAIRQYDPGRGTSIGSFVYHRILTGALARYRQEWSYARRCSSSPLSRDAIPEADETATLAEDSEHLRRSMSLLVDDDRRLLERLFWEGSTEVEVAGSMGISQQAVSKRKLKILAELRRRFGGRAER